MKNVLYITLTLFTYYYIINNLLIKYSYFIILCILVYEFIKNKSSYLKIDSRVT